jgi:hypothetical protein
MKTACRKQQLAKNIIFNIQIGKALHFIKTQEQKQKKASTNYPAAT